MIGVETLLEVIISKSELLPAVVVVTCGNDTLGPTGALVFMVAVSPAVTIGADAEVSLRECILLLLFTGVISTFFLLLPLPLEEAAS